MTAKLLVTVISFLTAMSAAGAAVSVTSRPAPAPFSRDNFIRRKLEAPSNYQFEYSVQDSKSGDMKQQRESRDGDAVHGHYSFMQPDGARRIVEYTADKTRGFNAVVRYEGGPVEPVHARAPPEPVIYSRNPLTQAPAPEQVTYSRTPLLQANYVQPAQNQIVYTPAPPFSSKVSYAPSPFSGTKVTYNSSPFSEAKASFVSSPFSEAEVSYTPSPFSEAKVSYTPSPFSEAKVSYTPSPFSEAKVSYTPSPFSEAKASYAPAPFSVAKVSYTPSPFSEAKASYASSSFSEAEVSYTPSSFSEAKASYAPPPFSEAKVEYVSTPASKSTMEYITTPAPAARVEYTPSSDAVTETEHASTPAPERKVENISTPPSGTKMEHAPVPTPRAKMEYESADINNLQYPSRQEEGRSEYPSDLETGIVYIQPVSRVPYSSAAESIRDTYLPASIFSSPYATEPFDYTHIPFQSLFFAAVPVQNAFSYSTPFFGLNSAADFSSIPHLVGVPNGYNREPSNSGRIVYTNAPAAYTHQSSTYKRAAGQEKVSSSVKFRHAKSS